MNIDTKKLKTDLLATIEELKVVKARFRESGQPQVGWIFEDGTIGRSCVRKRANGGMELAKVNTWQRKEFLAHKATLLCALRAHQRGRIHRKGMDMAAQAEYIECVVAEYQIV